MTKSKIEWTDRVWNPVTGCNKVSQGCKHCYAETIANRFWKDQYPPNADGSPRKFTDVWVHPDRLFEPEMWRKPQRVFVNSMSDLFHPAVPELFLLLVWDVMARTPQHTYMILTKRADRMQDFCSRISLITPDELKHLVENGVTLAPEKPKTYDVKPLPNVWLLVSIENQPAADERVPYLLQTPAAVRGVSCEPLLGPVNLEPYLQYPPFHENYKLTFGENEFRGLDWVICGGESGPGARPMHPDWARSLRDQCQEAGVPFFFKQWGEYVPNETGCGPDGYDYKNTHIAVSADGTVNKHWQEDEGASIMARAGKKVAGRLLDGQEWNEFPKGSDE